MTTDRLPMNSPLSSTSTQPLAAEGAPDPEQAPIRINLGCGYRIHPGWLNLDLNPVLPGVRRANFLRDQIPVAGASADCVYHSHLLEHLPPALARRLLADCYRVLRPGGILRIVVPDLEQSARDYLAALDRRRRSGDPTHEARQRHEWMIIELVDQLVRTRPGGQLARAVMERRIDAEFVAPRLGSSGKCFVDAASNGRRPARGRMERVLDRLERWLPGSWGFAIGQMLFRRIGEHHLWMYDELSLGDLLGDLGFEEIRRQDHLSSAIPGWSEFGLDAEPDGSPYKGVSLYLEARRPGDGTSAAPDLSPDHAARAGA